MDQNLIYAKTPNGDEAVRQSTRVVQRNLRMVLVQVDGKLTVGELAAKIGNAKLVEQALQELEEGGFIAPVLEAASVWEEAKKKIAQRVAATSPNSQFSTFGPKSLHSGDFKQSGDYHHSDGGGIPSVFSTFGKPILPVDETAPSESKPSLADKMSGMLSRRKDDDGPGRMPIEIRPKTFVWAALALILLGGLGLFVFPYNNYRPEVEAALSRAFVAPVKVEHIGFVATPRPGLVVQGVRIGEAGDAKIGEIRLPSPFALFGAGHKTLSGLEMSGVRLAADRFAGLASAPSGPAAPLIINQAVLKDVSLVIRDGVLANLSGEVFFKPAGGLDKLSLRSEDRTLRFDAMPTALGVALTIEGYGWKPLADAPYVFESMQAKGLLQKGKLVLQDVDTTFMGGVLRGSVLLDWSNGLVVAADAALARLNARRVGDVFAAPLKMDGELGGSLKLRSAAPDWSGLRKGVEGSMDAQITRGAIHGVDLGEAARRGAGRVTRSGQTRFEHLKAYLRIDGQKLAGSEVKLNAGLMTAEGQFVAKANAGVDGSFTVAIQGSTGTLRVPVRISGELPDLTAAAGPR